MATVLTPLQIAQTLQDAGWDRANIVIMTAITLAESGGDTGVISKPNTNGTVDRGLFQINSAHTNISDATALNPLEAAKAVLALYGTQGFNAWTTYSGMRADGSRGIPAYLVHLPAATLALAQLVLGNGVTSADAQRGTIPAIGDAAGGVGNAVGNAASDVGTFANDPFGVREAGAAFTASLETAGKVAERIAYGIVGIGIAIAGLYILKEEDAV